jgi:hypothetical protein
MGLIKKIIGLLLLVFVTYAGYFVYRNNSLLIIKNEKRENSYADQIKAKILKYEKPARIEIINYVKNPDHLFQKDIDQIKKIKVPLNKNSKLYIKIQFFVDETDPTAPLMGQFSILEIGTDNLIVEDSLKLD